MSRNDEILSLRKSGMTYVDIGKNMEYLEKEQGQYAECKKDEMKNSNNLMMQIFQIDWSLHC